MAHIISVRGKTPKIGKNCFIAETATIIGDVVIGDGCSIWYGAVVRGDVNSITIGDNTNIQDNAVIHGTYEKYATRIGSGVSVGHSAIVHGATIEDNSLIGMGATVLDNSVVEEDTVIAAGAVLSGGKRAERGGVYAGIPAKRIKELTPEDCERIIRTTAEHYQMYTTWYAAEEEKEHDN